MRIHTEAHLWNGTCQRNTPVMKINDQTDHSVLNHSGMKTINTKNKQNAHQTTVLITKLQKKTPVYSTEPYHLDHPNADQSHCVPELAHGGPVTHWDWKSKGWPQINSLSITRARTHIHACTHTCTHSQTHECAHTHTHTRTHPHTDIPTCTHTHTHAETYIAFFQKRFPLHAECSYRQAKNLRNWISQSSMHKTSLVFCLDQTGWCGQQEDLPTFI